jgi:hypothetical protein
MHIKAFTVLLIEFAHGNLAQELFKVGTKFEMSLPLNIPKIETVLKGSVTSFLLRVFSLNHLYRAFDNPI